MSAYKDQPFFKIALRFAVVLFVFVALIEVFFGLIKNGGFNGMVHQLFAEERWQYFLKRLVLLAAFYGVFMAGYYKFIKK